MLPSHCSRPLAHRTKVQAYGGVVMLQGRWSIEGWYKDLKSKLAYVLPTYACALQSEVYIQVILHHRSCVVCVGVCVRWEERSVDVPSLLEALALWHDTFHKAPHQERVLVGSSQTPKH